ncbi:MAG: hypothetical protein EA398_12965 [Deltaproteobacteria bacterium]|nr:MAG: hypothetical protein EA398_12965 [Deltaproteobacteria bacterium]
MAKAHDSISLLHLTLALAILLPLLPTKAHATNASLLVLPNRTEGLTIAEAEPVYDRVADIAADTGAFLVIAHDQLGMLVGDVGFARAVACNGEPECLAEVEELERFDFIVVVNVTRTAQTLRTDLALVDWFGGRAIATASSDVDAGPDSLQPAVLTLLSATGLVARPDAPQPPPATQEYGAPQEPRPVVARQPLRPSTPADWLLIGGAVGITGGVLLGFAADATQQDIQARPSDRERLEQLQARGQRRQTAGNLLLVGGAAALGTGVVLRVIGREDATSTDASVQPVPGGVILRGSTRF